MPQPKKARPLLNESDRRNLQIFNGEFWRVFHNHMITKEQARDFLTMLKNNAVANEQRKKAPTFDIQDGKVTKREERTIRIDCSVLLAHLEKAIAKPFYFDRYAISDRDFTADEMKEYNIRKDTNGVLVDAPALLARNIYKVENGEESLVGSEDRFWGQALPENDSPDAPMIVRELLKAKDFAGINIYDDFIEQNREAKEWWIEGTYYCGEMLYEAIKTAIADLHTLLDLTEASSIVQSLPIDFEKVQSTGMRDFRRHDSITLAKWNESTTIDFGCHGKPTIKKELTKQARISGAKVFDMKPSDSLICEAIASLYDYLLDRKNINKGIFFASYKEILKTIYGGGDEFTPDNYEWLKDRIELLNTVQYRFEKDKETTAFLKNGAIDVAITEWRFLDADANTGVYPNGEMAQGIVIKQRPFIDYLADKVQYVKMLPKKLKHPEQKDSKGRTNLLFSQKPSNQIWINRCARFVQSSSNSKDDNRKSTRLSVSVLNDLLLNENGKLPDSKNFKRQLDKYFAYCKKIGYIKDYEIKEGFIKIKGVKLRELKEKNEA